MSGRLVSNLLRNGTTYGVQNIVFGSKHLTLRTRDDDAVQINTRRSGLGSMAALIEDRFGVHQALTGSCLWTVQVEAFSIWTEAGKDPGTCINNMLERKVGVVACWISSGGGGGGDIGLGADLRWGTFVGRERLMKEALEVRGRHHHDRRLCPVDRQGQHGENLGPSNTWTIVRARHR